MFPFLKILMILGIFLIFIYPLCPWPRTFRKISTFRALRYDAPENKKNFPFIILAVNAWTLFVVLTDLLDKLCELLTGLPFISQIFSHVEQSLSVYGKFTVDVLFRVLLFNIISLYGFLIAKAFFKASLLDPIFNGTKRLKKAQDELDEEQKEPEQQTQNNENEENSDDSSVPVLVHTDEEVTEEETSETTENTETYNFKDNIKNAILNLFFLEPDHIQARNWVIRAESLLQLFIYGVEIIYAVVFLGFITAIFFPLPTFFYHIFHFFLQRMSLYPFLAMIFLQEICNTLKTENPNGIPAPEEEVKKEKKNRASVSLDRLRTKLFRRFGKIHEIRCFPAPKRKEVIDYSFANQTYACALQFIEKRMKDESGYAVQSYLRGLDSAFNDQNVYFGASFYSQLGEYLIAYTYIRLLSGERMTFITSDKKKAESLKAYIGKRLTTLTGTSEQQSWRIRIAADTNRLENCDILIATPEDFLADNIIEHNPSFFEEVCNTVFVDADRTISLDSYLCTIMAKRLQAVTNGRVRFIFSSRHIIYGFANSLRKFFCIDDVLECSSADENEHVSYMIWNRESPLIYEEHRQHLVSLEGQIAKAAFHAGIDGVRIWTASPLDTSEKEYLRSHGVEINKLYKDIPKISYMICSDDQYNLASALYAFTRFRGEKESFLHILVKPYLLREYFMAHIEDYVNSSSFIKPRVTEHAEEEKRRLLCVFLDATSTKDGMRVSEFEERIRIIRKDYHKEENSALASSAKLKNDVIYLLETLAEQSISDTILNYYQLSGIKNGYQLDADEHITFRQAEYIFKELQKYNTRVSLWFNDKKIGILETFPSRVFQQYIPGQSIVFENTEYEISQISDDGSRIDLRQRNVTFRNCLDTMFLRKYRIDGNVNVQGVNGAYTHSNGTLEGIYVSFKKADRIEGTTYGFYNLMTDSQTLDFVRGVVGNSELDEAIVNQCRRNLKDVSVLSLRLVSREECNDKMRLLLSVVLNEMMRTLFPDTYRCIAICPILEQPITDTLYEGINANIASIYPYITADSDAIYGASEPNYKNEIEFLLINDCKEDVGILNMLYDGQARILEEVLSYVYSYLDWLKETPSLPGKQKHFIYFGGDSLPEIFDLDGCVQLLANCARRFENDIAPKPQTETDLLCSFCHKPLSKGRYFKFDKTRLICVDCEANAIVEEEDLQSVYNDVRSYLKENYPDVSFPADIQVKHTPLFHLNEDEFLSEHYYRVEADSRTILVEQDHPKNNTFISILHGMIRFWQLDNNLLLSCAHSQLYFEECLALRGHNCQESVDWLRKTLDEETLLDIGKIEAYIKEAPEGEKRTSFSYMFLKGAENPSDGADDDESADDGEGGFLYDPDETPRFWKQYLIGKHASDDDDGNDNEDGDAVEDDDTDTESETEDILKNADEDENDVSDSEDEALEDETGNEDETSVSENDPDDGLSPKERKKKAKREAKKKKNKPKKKTGVFSRNQLKSGMELIPYEKEEDTNPKLKLYNEIARHIADFSTEAILVYGLPFDEIRRIFDFVLYDYPEFFWVSNSFSYINTVSMTLHFRCLDKNGDIDIRRIKKYRMEIRRAAKPFIKGIKRTTNPYEALLTIYRRVVKTLDYDNEKLDIDRATGDRTFARNYENDDTLRSLYSALKHHKVVCVGYAVAMQYLLQSVGICCGQIVSETHSWNVVKLGKHCYHLDATWGDSSKTKDNTDNPLKDVVRYDYFCITTKENNAGGAERIPDPKIFRGLEEFCSTKHNYFHHEGAYLTKYDENQLTQIFKNAIVSRDGVINIRCANKQLCTAVAGRLMKDGRATEIMKNAFAAMNDQQRKRFRNCSLDGRYYYDFKLNIIYILLKMK